MTLLESFTCSFVSSSRLELRCMVIRSWSATLAYDVTEPEAMVTLYLFIDNRIQSSFSILLKSIGSLCAVGGSAGDWAWVMLPDGIDINGRVRAATISIMPESVICF